MNNFKTILVWVLSANTLMAKELSFEKVWLELKDKSAIQKAAQMQIESAEEFKSRANRHWLPKIYLDAKIYNTNDPGTSFFGLLEQRKVTAADFNPDVLNHPEASTYSRAALGIDLPLYEGSMKHEQAELSSYMLDSKKMESFQVQIEQYAVVGMAYSSIAVLGSQYEKLIQLQKRLQSLMASYQIGQQSNPVGYSGLLGMKSLSNRLAALLDQYKAQKNSYQAILKEMGLDSSGWSPIYSSTTLFVDEYFNVKSDQGESYLVKAKAAEAKAALSMAHMEQARFLPRLGAFAESHIFDGSRETANGYTAGLYLQWSLFDSSDFGRLKEAKLKAMAAEKQIEAYKQQTRAEKAAGAEALSMMKSNLILLQNSEKIMSEQARVATDLFQNGSLSALQIVEIINRRVDLLTQQTDLEMSLIKTATDHIKKQEFQIPINNGGAL